MAEVNVFFYFNDFFTAVAHRTLRNRKRATDSQMKYCLAKVSVLTHFNDFFTAVAQRTLRNRKRATDSQMNCA